MPRSEATVVATGTDRTTLLVEDMELDSRAAATMHCKLLPIEAPSTKTTAAGDHDRSGNVEQAEVYAALAVTIAGRSTVVSVEGASGMAAIGSRVLLDYTLQRNHTKASRTRSLARLRRLLEHDPDQLDERGCRHALLYVLEGKEASLRDQRLQLLRKALIGGDAAPPLPLSSQEGQSL